MPYIPCPQIDTYQSANANPASRWIAIFRDGPKKHLPMNFWAASEEGAIERAAAFWAEGQERIARKKELAAAMSERMRRKPASAVNEPERAA